MDRRTFLVTSAFAGGVSMNTAIPETLDERPAAPPPIGALLNRERASRLMRRAGFDALLVTLPLNVYYATNAVPVLSRFSPVNTTAAVVPADSSAPIAYLSSGFEYYAGVTDSGVAAGVQPYLVGGGFGNSDPHASPAFASAGSYAFDAREQRRRALLGQAAPFFESMSKAAAKALKDRGLEHGVIGVDTADAHSLVRHAAARADVRMADDLVLHIRLVKTDPELLLMRRASANNVDAAVVTAKAAREDGGVWRVRQRFFQEAAARGNAGVYASVDLVMSELADGPFREGQAFMIDFVSHYAFYQGDYGRTVYYGEPDPKIRQAAEVGATAWREIRERLRPGLKFSDIHRIGNETVRKLGHHFVYAFNPHSVGLQHWDHPRTALDGTPVDLELEAGMVLSIDCPLLNSGVNGTTHIEDLTLITERGSEPLHRSTDDAIQV
jgi:Xaa-Pro aminopeptidase